ncbi:MAG: NAD(P)H-quinone oxidoreductase [Pseudomonadota bacterium]
MATMRVIEHGDGGGPEVMHLGEAEIPVPGAGQILIKVTGAGVNGPDLKQRAGSYPPPPGASPLLGLEVSGHVAAMGADVSGWSEGDTICALTNGGGYAEYVAVDAGHCLPIPGGVELMDAAGLCETFFTVWSNTWHGHDVPRGKTLLVHGGGGGIGSTAVQLGRAMGLKVLTTAGSEASRDMATRMGADRVINYREEDFVEITREAGGADIIIDMFGGPYIARNIKAANPDARLIHLAFDLGPKVELNFMPMMLKRLTLTGATLRSRPPEFKTAVATGLREQVWPLFAQGQLQTVTHKVFDLADASDAHALMESGGHAGKVLLRL